MSILHCVNSPEMARVVAALHKEFDCPVVHLVMWQFVEQELATWKDLGWRGPVYSVPGFYFEHIDAIRAMSLDELDKAQRELEAWLDISENVRTVYYDRAFFKIHDFRKAREIQVVYLMLAKKILEENDLDLVLLGREQYFWNILADAALRRGIPAMVFTSTRHVGLRMCGLDSQGRQLGMPEAFEALTRGEHPDPEGEKEAEALYREFVDRPVRPQYISPFVRSVSRSFKGILFGGVRAIARNMKMYRDNEFDRESGFLDSSLAAISRWPTKAVVMTRLLHTDFLVRRPDFDRKYIYLPLHHTPEVSDLFYGEQYTHHESFVTDVARRLPSDYTLYVKDHTSMAGNRPLFFYKNLKKLYNVEVLHPSVSTFDLIRNSRAVLTVTGTAGWEAYLLNKPVIVLGNVFYNFLPNVLRTNLDEPDFTRQVEEYLAGFTPDPESARLALHAHYLSSVPVSFDIGNLRELGPNVAEYVRAVHPLVEKWGRWVAENDPRGKSIARRASRKADAKG
ncbi:hypothetical protein [Pseudodesulfovibrio sp.]|uniref:capsular polysaccharide export protein, LipB/KpsS family n=1 Tax=Pseudodesulfovibrio sp. TaxID=2035812 RepID=UPI00260A380A|nr:hypothetical protein [Pseudodesulfovibrio sp.]MDD3312782.1 hypothetical protein [Pseudodesulfovibrio sp.]